jgi:hypothetical protein
MWYAFLEKLVLDFGSETCIGIAVQFNNSTLKPSTNKVFED